MDRFQPWSLGHLQDTVLAPHWVGDVTGAFNDHVGRKTAAAASITSVHDQIAIRQDETRKQSHTTGFEVSKRYLVQVTAVIWCLVLGYAWHVSTA